MKNRRTIDVQSVFFKMEPRTLTAAYRFYCNKELVGAHGAEADTRATFEILKAQVDRYEELKGDSESLAQFTQPSQPNADLAGMIKFNAQGDEIFNFGKHKGKKVTDILDREPGYYAWMQNADFPAYTKKVLTAIKLRNRSMNIHILSAYLPHVDRPLIEREKVDCVSFIYKSTAVFIILVAILVILKLMKKMKSVL